MGLENKRRNAEVVKCSINQGCTPPSVGSKYCANFKEGWKGKNVCRFQIS